MNKQEAQTLASRKGPKYVARLAERARPAIAPERRSYATDAGLTLLLPHLAKVAREYSLEDMLEAAAISGRNLDAAAIRKVLDSGSCVRDDFPGSPAKEERWEVVYDGPDGSQDEGSGYGHNTGGF